MARPAPADARMTAERYFPDLSLDVADLLLPTP
jgi:hypothetical protein